MSQERFFQMLNLYPRIRDCWSSNNKSLNVDALNKELDYLSTGERHMAKFFASLWFNDNKRYGFDLVDAIAYLDEHEKALILQWISNPFWP